MTTLPPNLPHPPRTLTVVLFDGFESLDVFGPVEVFGHAPDWQINYATASAHLTPVTSAQGLAVSPTHRLSDLSRAEDMDVLLTPGGPGTRALVNDAQFLDTLTQAAAGAQVVASVCTGSALLARAGLLDGFRATSNKLAFAWATSQSAAVKWEGRARWVADGNRWTASGVAAGIDMAFALVREINGEAAAQEVAKRIEMQPHLDADDDPFAVVHATAAN